MNRTAVKDDDWWDWFQPIGAGDGPIQNVPPGIPDRLVWSCINGETGDEVVSGYTSGYAYWICQVPVPDGEHYVVQVDKEWPIEDE